MKIAITPIAAALALAFTTAPLVAQEPAPGIIGKNGWLYYNHEFLEDAPGAAKAIDLVGRINKQLVANGTQVLVAMAPIKIRLYPENLPDNRKLTPSLQGQYDAYMRQLAAAGVKTVDINKTLLTSPKRNDKWPLYFRQDTHWAAPGALAAAEAIKAAVLADPALKGAYDATPVAPYTLMWSDKDWPMTGDLVQQLPKGSPAMPQEGIGAFSVTRGAQQGGGLLGNAPEVGITLMGSSYTADWTLFSAAVRYTLQRDTLAMSIAADQGQWVGLETYLREDAFQTNRPKLLIWEMPERDVKAGPSMPYREARYVMDDTEWLLKASAWVQKSCAASANKVSIDAASLGKGRAGADVSAATTTPQDYVELNFAQPVDKLEYLSARILDNGSKLVQAEASGPGVEPRKFTLNVAGDEGEHAFKTPLLSKGKGYTKLRLYPGASKGFALKSVQLCQQPAGLI